MAGRPPICILVCCEGKRGLVLPGLQGLLARFLHNRLHCEPCRVHEVLARRQHAAPQPRHCSLGALFSFSKPSSFTLHSSFPPLTPLEMQGCMCS